jgi:hypothetical protein
MLNAREDIAYIYVFASVISALALVTFTVIDNNMIIRKVFERIVSETAHITLALAATQARSSFIDSIAA